MLSAKRKSDGQTVLANFESKSNGPFTCAECSEEVILRKGIARTGHFAHKSPITCKYGTGETESHRRCKMAIYEALLRQPGVTKVAMERSLKSVRPDVSAFINGVPVAIEVQISNLSLETIAHRTSEYARKGIYVLWLAQWTPYLDGQRYSPRLWEKWVHAAYFGRVYYWVEGLTIVPYRFDPHFSRVPENYWYSESGKEMRAGGYRRKSKRYRLPIRGKNLNLAGDFIRSDREHWESKIIKIPPAKLYVDRHRDSIPDSPLSD
jgi:competence protein CoiA